MARRRTKSMRQINQQAIRLAEAEYMRSDTDRARLQRISDINRRYRQNIARAYGDGQWVRNENYDRPVSRSVYMGLNVP